MDLLTFLILQIPVVILVVKGFHTWSVAKTLEMHKIYGGEGRDGIAIRKFGITMYHMPYNANTIELMSAS